MVRLDGRMLLPGGCGGNCEARTRPIESIHTLETRNVITKNNGFRQATLRPRSGATDARTGGTPAPNFEKLFGEPSLSWKRGSNRPGSFRRGDEPGDGAAARSCATLESEGLAGREPLQAAQRTWATGGRCGNGPEQARP